MRLTLLISLLFINFACTSTKKVVAEVNPLNGTWIPIKQEFSGAPLPASAFEKQQLIINDSNYTVIAESVDKGLVKRSADKMDIYGKEGVNTGKHFTAIYKLETGVLTICYNLTGSGYPENFETKGKPMHFLSVFKKN